MGSLLNMREPLRANVASWVSVPAAESPPAATHATLQMLLRLYEQPNHVLAQRLGRSSLPKEEPYDQVPIQPVQEESLRTATALTQNRSNQIAPYY